MKVSGMIFQGLTYLIIELKGNKPIARSLFVASFTIALKVNRGEYLVIHGYPCLKVTLSGNFR